MNMTYLGSVQHSDPLYDYLHYDIQPKMGWNGDREFRVFRLHASNSVFLYEETRSCRRLIGKFYSHGAGPNRSHEHAAMEREYANLNYMRSQGFSGCTYHYIACPLGQNSGLNELLLEEYCCGESLSSVIQRSIRNSDPALLFRKLTALAYFLSHFHNRTAKEWRVDLAPVTEYAHDLIRTISDHGWISDHRKEKLREMISRWSEKPEMRSDNQVLVHGDATPENFLFGDGLHVISFDLERMRYADRMFDAGRLAAELAHFFMLYKGDRGCAEPFIGHLLWEYSCHFPDRDAAFHSITKRLPFYMGINFLRIARNAYFDWNYRQRLLNAASECLKGGLQ